jgi:hypothetical protein
MTTISFDSSCRVGWNSKHVGSFVVQKIQVVCRPGKLGTGRARLGLDELAARPGACVAIALGLSHEFASKAFNLSTPVFATVRGSWLQSLRLNSSSDRVTRKPPAERSPSRARSGATPSPG